MLIDRRHFDCLRFGLVLLLALASSSWAVEPLRYAGQVTFEPAAGTLSAALDLHLPLDDESGRLTFFFNSGLKIETLTGQAVLGHVLEPFPGNEDWNQLHVDYAPARAGQALAIAIRYSGEPIMPKNGINRISRDWIELTVDSAWHPVVASLLRPIHAELDLELPENWTVVTSGEVRATERGVRLSSRFPQSDVAFTAAPHLETAGTDEIRVYYREVDDAAIARVLDRAAACRDWLDERFGPESHLPPARFTVTDREQGGYSRINYIALTRIDDVEPESLTAFLCHELGHFWSRGAPPMSVENWLNEAFAVLLGALAAREMYGEDAYAEQLRGWIKSSQDTGSIWTPNDLARRDFATNYKKGPWFLHRLRERIGAEAFERLLRRYALAPINTTPDLLDAIEAIAGRAHREWAAAQLAVEGPFSG